MVVTPARTPHPLLPVDYCVAAYNVLLVAVWAPLMFETPAARWMVVVHAVALSVPFLLWHVSPSQRHPLFGLVRELYPIVLVLIFWRELGLHFGYIDTGPGDAFVTGLDRAFFGQHPHLLWMPAMPQVWFSEVMHAFYFSYYPLLVLVPLAVLCSGSADVRRDAVLRLTIGYLGCFAVYACLPSIGPTLMLPPGADGILHGAFYRLTAAIEAAGNSLGTAFPSSHVAGAVTAAWLARRHLSAPVAWVCGVAALGVALATVYTQNHYVVDTLAGAGLTVALQAIAVPALTAGLPRLKLAKRAAASI